MKFYALLLAALALVGWQPALFLVPINLIADGIAAITLGVPWWFLALTIGAALIQRKFAHRPRIRVVPGQYARKA